MQRPYSQLFVAILAFACVSFPLARTSVAGKVNFPSDNPAFTVELPSGWTHTRDKNGNLSCDAHDDSGYSFSILDLKGGSERKATQGRIA